MADVITDESVANYNAQGWLVGEEVFAPSEIGRAKAAIDVEERVQGLRRR